MPRLTRRRFLETSAAAIAAATIPRTIVSAEKPQPAAAVDFGFSLYGMRSLKVTDAIRACAEIGYDSVELVANAGWPCDPAATSKSQRRAIREALGETGLKMPSVMENLHAVVEPAKHRENLDRLKAAAELGHDVSPDRVPVVETILGGRPEQWEATRDRMATALDDWAKIAEATKTVLAVKPHVGGALHTPAGAEWLVERVDSPWIRLTYDYSHFQLRDFDLAKSLERLLPHAAFVHVKDTRGQAGKFRFLLPGDGDIDYAAYFGLLKRQGYRGSVTVEVSGQIHGQPGYDPIAAAKHSYENLAPVFERAGLKRVSG